MSSLTPVPFCIAPSNTGGIQGLPATVLGIDIEIERSISAAVSFAPSRSDLLIN